MADTFTPEVRRRTMQAVKSSKTGLESELTHTLWHQGMRFRRNVRSLPGAPDIAIKKYHFVVFIDSCFWHGCPVHFRLPETNREYWQTKIEKTRERDVDTNEYYASHDWTIVRVWEHDLRYDKQRVMDAITNALGQAKQRVTGKPVNQE
jgi:DNA mismatch endonuclease, patch repair protein